MAHTTDTPAHYVVREEFREAWGSPQPGTSISMDDICRLAVTWGVRVERLLDQVAPARYYRATDDVAAEKFEAATMDDAAAITRGLWESAEPGTYDVTIFEYASDEDRAHGPHLSEETITVEAK